VTVRPSAPQDYQYTSYTGYNPVLNPVCFWREFALMLTRVVAKQAKTAKVEKKFVNGKKFQKNTKLSFWWKGKSLI